MPVYNHARYVGQAVRSVQAQTHRDWELLIVDDGSTDGSGELVDELAKADERITALHQANAGPAAARNLAISKSRGVWLTYIDSDDLWFPETLANYADYIAAHPDAQFIYGYRHRLNRDGSVTELAGQYQDRPTGTAELFARMHLSHLCVCYRRRLIDRTGGYDETLRSCEDYELYLRMSLHCRFEPLGAPTGLRRRHSQNLSRQSGYSRMLEAEVLSRFIQRQGGAEVLDDGCIRRRLGRLYYSAGRQYFKARCFGQALAATKLAHKHARTFRSTGISLLSRLLLPLGRTDERQIPRL